MKKIKYLLGLSIIGLGLIINTSYSDTLYVDGAVSSVISTGVYQSSNYLYTFVSDDYYDGSAGLGYTLYYDGNTYFNGSPQCVHRRQYDSLNFGDLNSANFTNSISSFSPFNWWRARDDDTSTFTCTANSIYQGNIKYLLGYSSDTSIGKNFIYLGSYSDTGSVKYGFVRGFVDSQGFYEPLSTTDSNYVRFVYSPNNVTNVNPFDTYSPVTLSGYENFQNGLFRWQIFYSRGTRTNYGYIVDDGYKYNKYKHFGLTDLSYSYTYNKGDNPSYLTWSDIGFRSVSSSVEAYLQTNGSLSFVDFIAYLDPIQGNNNYSWNGLLVLKPSTYKSLSSDSTYYVLSKNPDNLQEILYEKWSCGNVDLMIKNSCTKFEAGKISYNGSTNVLPFTTPNDDIQITSIDNSFPLLYDLFGNSLDSHGYTKLGNSCLYINNDSRCYGLEINNDVDIIELYLNSMSNFNPNDEFSSNTSIASLCNLGFLSSAYCDNISNGSGTFYYTYLDGSGNVVVGLLPEGFESDYELVRDDNLGWTYRCTKSWCQYQQIGSIEYTDDINSILYSGQILGTGYYENYFKNLNSSNGFFFKCPYEYSVDEMIIGGNLLDKIGGFDIFLPVNCFITAYNKGREFIFDTRIDLHNDFGRLLKPSDDKNLNALFLFFDVLLSLGIFILILNLYHKTQ